MRIRIWQAVVLLLMVSAVILVVFYELVDYLVNAL